MFDAHYVGIILTRQTDYAKTAVSLAMYGLKNPLPLIASLVPHLVVLGAFGAFIVWNNGVVLGKKRSDFP